MSAPASQLARLALLNLPPGERAALLAEMTATRPERILSRADVASRFNRTPRAVDQWARKGLLHKVKLLLRIEHIRLDRQRAAQHVKECAKQLLP